MFSDFMAVCWDLVANEIAKYALHDQRPNLAAVGDSHGQWRRLALRRAAFAECRELGDGHTGPQSGGPNQRRPMSKACSRPRYAIPEPRPFLRAQSAYSTKGEVPDGEHVDTLGTAAIRRHGSDLTIAALD